MKLIYIRSIMEPKNYSIILKKEQGEKIASYIFELADTKSLQTYLDRELPMKFTKKENYN